MIVVVGGGAVVGVGLLETLLWESLSLLLLLLLGIDVGGGVAGVLGDFAVADGEYHGIAEVCYC